MSGRPLEVAVIGTGTGVGKTFVTRLLVHGLRQQSRQVWVHKPIACGGWDGGSAEDGRILASLADDAQPAESVCPLQFPTSAAPALAATLAGATVTVAQLRSQLERCRGVHDLVIESAGGLLSPLSSDRRGILEILSGSGIPAIVVCTPELGTLNVTALTCREAQREGLPLLGLVLNHAGAPQGGAAESHAAEELCALTGLVVLHTIAHQQPTTAGQTLASAVLTAFRAQLPVVIPGRSVRA